MTFIATWKNGKTTPQNAAKRRPQQHGTFVMYAQLTLCAVVVSGMNCDSSQKLLIQRHINSVDVVYKQALSRTSLDSKLEQI